MQMITTRNEYYVQDHHSLIEEEQVADPKHFLSYRSCHRSDNDCFVDHLGEERSIDMTCMLDDVFYTDDFPQFDQYDDDYVLQTEANIIDKPAASLWEEEVHFQQFKYSDQSSQTEPEVSQVAFEMLLLCIAKVDECCFSQSPV